MYLIILVVLGIVYRTKADCGPPPIVEHSTNNASFAETFPENTIIRYRCGYAFDRYGWPLYTCSDGAWTNRDRSMECVWKNCGAPEIEHGEYNLQSYTVGNIAQFTCNEGYTLQGSPRSVCRVDRQWTRLPTCQVVHCPSLPDGYKLSRHQNYNNGDRDSYGSTAENVCDRGFVLRGSSQQVCQGDGTWSGEHAYCEAIDCGEPNIGDGNVEGLYGDTGYLAFGIVTCNEGSTLSGTQEIMCEEDGWGSTYCNRGCSSPEILHGSAEQTSISHGDTLHWSCNNGYTRSPENDTVKCSDGRHVPQPSCAPILFGDSACPSETTNIHTARYGGTCYIFIKISQTYESARQTCYNYGGSMLMINGAETSEFIGSALKALGWDSDESPWLGMKYSESAEPARWVWNDNRYVTYTDWQPGEGHQSCIVLVYCWKNQKCAVLEHEAQVWRWNDVSCSGGYSVICQTHAL